MRHFRNFLLFGFLLAICIFSDGCTRDPGHNFELDLFFDLDIPAGLNTLESHFFIIEDVPTFYESFRDGSVLMESEVGEIFPGWGRFSTRLSDIDLNFINAIGIHVIDPEDPTVRHEAFFIDFVPLGNKDDIDIIPSIVEMAEFLKQPTVDLEFRINFRSFIPQPIDARIEMNFLVFEKE